MYAHRRISAPIRDPAPTYGEPDRDRFPADDVLEDLTRGDDDDTGRVHRVLARYAALRHWLLRLERAPPALTRHARHAARAHLSTAARWDEGDLLRALLTAPLPEAASLLSAAGTLAARSGDPAGAAALRQAARQATRFRLPEGFREN